MLAVRLALMNRQKPKNEVYQWQVLLKALIMTLGNKSKNGMLDRINDQNTESVLSKKIKK